MSPDTPEGNRNPIQEQIINIPAYFDRPFLLVTFITLFLLLLYFGSPPDYSVKRDLREGVSLSSSTRTTLSVACMDNVLRPGLRYDDPEIGLWPSEKYTGKNVKSVTFSVPDLNSMKVVVTYKRISAPGWFGTEGKNILEDGSTWIYRGVCDAGGTTWYGDPKSTVPVKYWPDRLQFYVDPGAKKRWVKLLAKLRTQPRDPNCNPGVVGVENSIASPVDHQSVDKSSNNGIKGVTYRFKIGFVNNLADVDIVDAICRINGTIVRYFPVNDPYISSISIIEISGTTDLALPESTLEQLRSDPRVKWVYSIDTI